MKTREEQMDSAQQEQSELKILLDKNERLERENQLLHQTIKYLEMQLADCNNRREVG